jgi:hypothetical protein
MAITDHVMPRLVRDDIDRTVVERSIDGVRAPDVDPPSNISRSRTFFPGRAAPHSA